MGKAHFVNRIIPARLKLKKKKEMRCEKQRTFPFSRSTHNVDNTR